MAILTNNLLSPEGTLKKDGVTFYRRKGKIIMRSATTEQSRRNTRKQFIARQRLSNNTAIWKVLLGAMPPVLSGGNSSYGRFCTLMCKVPVTYLTKSQRRLGASLLVPGIPVSDGMMTDIEYRLGKVEGRSALLTSLRLGGGYGTLVEGLYAKGCDLKKGDRLVLYRLRQVEEEAHGEAVPKVRARAEVLTYDDGESEAPFRDIELRNVDGHLALVGDVFADEMRGWALVRMDAEGVRTTTQCVVTRCRFYERYTTEEALQRAAESYGGLTQLKKI